MTVDDVKILGGRWVQVEAPSKWGGPFYMCLVCGARASSLKETCTPFHLGSKPRFSNRDFQRVVMRCGGVVWALPVEERAQQAQDMERRNEKRQAARERRTAELMRDYDLAGYKAVP